MLTVIEGIKKEKPDMESIYLRCFGDVAKKGKTDRDSLMRLVFYGIKYINASSRRGKDYQGLKSRFDFICLLKNTMGLFTPADLLKMFPVDKQYDGQRYEMKDYFFTMKKLNEHGINKPMGEDVTEVLWDYMNFSISRFECECMGVMSDILRCEGKPGVIEEFFAGQGVQMSTMHKDSKGRTYLTDGARGKTTRVFKKKPRGWSLIINKAQ